MSVLPNQQNETVQWMGHPRRMRIAGPALAGGTLCVLSAVPIVLDLYTGLSVPWIGIVVSAVGIVLGLSVPCWSYIVLLNTRFVITDEAVYTKRGVFTTRVDRISHPMIQNSTLVQDRFGRLLDYGSIRIDTAGVTAALVFSDLRDPRSVISRLERTTGKSDSQESIPGTLEQWQAIAEEVRAIRAAIAIE